MRLLKQRGLTPLVFPNHSNLEQRPKDTLHLRTIQRLADFCNLLTGESDDVFEFVVRILSQVMEVPVVCLSQVVGNELNCIFEHYISKPVDVQQLRPIIERYLSSTSPPQPTNGEDI